MALYTTSRPIMRLIGWLTVFSCLLGPLGSMAEPYLITDLAYTLTKPGAQPFQTWLTRFRGGYLINDVTSVEFGYGINVIDDTEIGLSTKVAHHYAFNLRLYTGQFEIIRPYLLVGYGRTRLKLHDANRNIDVSERFHGPTAAFGLEERFRRWPNLWITAEGFTWIEKQDIYLRGISLGIRYDF